jgi:hypothetical protein
MALCMDYFLFARVAAACFGAPTLLGVLWFSDSLSLIMLITGTALGVCCLGAAFSARGVKPDGSVRSSVTTLCIVGIAAGLVWLMSDVSSALQDPGEWIAVAIRLASIGALTVIALESTTVLRNAE